VPLGFSIAKYDNYRFGEDEKWERLSDRQEKLLFIYVRVICVCCVMDEYYLHAESPLSEEGLGPIVQEQRDQGKYLFMLFTPAS
jgi:hypothetical protein